MTWPTRLRTLVALENGFVWVLHGNETTLTTRHFAHTLSLNSALKFVKYVEVILVSVGLEFVCPSCRWLAPAAAIIVLESGACLGTFGAADSPRCGGDLQRGGADRYRDSVERVGLDPSGSDLH